MVTLFGKEKAVKDSYGPDIGDNIGTSVSHLKTTLSKHSVASFRCFEKHSTKELVVWSVRNQLVMKIGSWLGPHPILTTKAHTHTCTINLKGRSGLTHQTLDGFAAWHFKDVCYMQYVQATKLPVLLQSYLL